MNASTMCYRNVTFSMFGVRRTYWIALCFMDVDNIITKLHCTVIINIRVIAGMILAVH